MTIISPCLSFLHFLCVRDAPHHVTALQRKYRITIKLLNSVCGGGGALRDNSCRRIVGNIASSHHALHAVRQQQDDAVLADPLSLSGTDKLVDDTLGRVVEVSKLGLPQNQSVWTGHGEPQLEP